MTAPLRIPARPEMVLGEGTVDDLPELVRRLGGDAAFVITDRGLVAAGVAGLVAGRLEAAGLRTGVHDGIGANPSAADVLAGSDALRAFGGCVIVAVGGGSPIDAAKAIALHAATPDQPSGRVPTVAGVDPRGLEALADGIDGLAPAGPLIAVPTTAGTGTETNGFAVIDDHAARRKRYVGHPSALPRFAVLDPALSMSAPPLVTAACGIDVLAHAIESLQARTGNAYSAALGLEAVRLVGGASAGGRRRPERPRGPLGDAAGRAPGRPRLRHHRARDRPCDRARALGPLRDPARRGPGGRAAARRPPQRARARRRHSADRGGRGRRPRPVEAAVTDLQERSGMHPTLRELGVQRADLPALADAALADVVIDNAPRVPARGELVDLLDVAF